MYTQVRAKLKQAFRKKDTRIVVAKWTHSCAPLVFLAHEEQQDNKNEKTHKFQTLHFIVSLRPFLFPSLPLFSLFPVATCTTEDHKIAPSIH
jgi:hypothetical protein